jgi:hypothetical protein
MCGLAYQIATALGDLNRETNGTTLPGDRVCVHNVDKEYMF